MVDIVDEARKVLATLEEDMRLASAAVRREKYMREKYTGMMAEDRKLNDVIGDLQEQVVSLKGILKKVDAERGGAEHIQISPDLEGELADIFGIIKRNMAKLDQGPV